MSRRQTEPRSIASQLVLLFTPAAAFLLCCGIGVLYWTVVRHAFAEDRAVLADKVFAVRADLKAAGGPAVIKEQFKATRPSDRAAYWVRVIDSAGRSVAETPGMEKLLPASVFSADQTADPARGGVRDYSTGQKLFSIVSTKARAGDREYTLQIAQDRTMDEEFEKSFGLLVAAVLVGGIFASAAIAITVTRRGLRPLAAMTNSLRRVGADRLDERVPPNEWPRELQPVAIAFDDMLDRLQDSFTRLSQFSADLAHELRTPIANIRGEAEVALTRPRSPNEYQAVIESSVAECERLSGIIDNLLFLARAEASEGQVHRQEFDARAAVEKIAAYYEAVAEERRIRLICQGEGSIFADPLLFERTLSNLVDNALRFTPEEGTISITVDARSGLTEIVVQDTGAGIAAEHLRHVFDRFYRADPARSSEGTGLGLALVKSIAELHGGSVAIESERARGTKVTLRFPAPATKKAIESDKIS
ncbi:MAG: heavy metal sensor histidine kinase [Chthoniobacterales bacterium]|nr:heavy metal sensor histidine kinase [Chthoniobacterales bacterium]